MAVKPTKEQKLYLGKAEYEYKVLHKPMAPCPKCGKALVIEELDNGARTIHCKDAECISYTIRGL